MRTRQWYETEDGARRLAVEMEAVALFNRAREPALRLTGKKHGTGHLIFGYAFRPLATRPDVVRGELCLASAHPEVEPVARIDEPALLRCGHVIAGEVARRLAQNRIPRGWAEEGGAQAICMWSHGGDRDSWKPSYTAVTAVLNVQSWFLNYLVWVNTGRWPFDPRSENPGAP